MNAIQKLRNRISNLFFKKEDLILEHRVFNAISLILCVFVFHCFIFSILIKLYIQIVPCLLLSISSFLVYYKAKVHKVYWYKFFLASALFSIVFFFITGDGLRGSNDVLVLGLLCVFLVLTKPSQHVFYIALFLAINLILGIMHLVAPNFIINPYEKEIYQLIDNWISPTVYVLVIGTIISYMKKCYDKERELNQKQKKEVEEASRQKNMLFSNLAHETKTPLTLVQNYLARYMERTNNENEELSIVKSNINKLCRDIENFMDIEQMEKTELVLEKEVLDLSKILKEKKILFSEIAIKKKIKINLSVITEAYVKANFLAIDRILNNLLDNAIKYTQVGGEINTILKVIDEGVEIHIKDNGEGISIEQQQHIFKPYYQASHKKSNVQGLGMGLFITKRAVEQIGGELELISKEGEGTEFIVYLKKHVPSKNDLIISPELRKPFDTISNSTQKIAKRNNPGNINLLLVEDNPDMLNYLYEELSQEFNVYTAANGKDALDKLKTIKQLDLIMSDIMMDEMDGIEFYKHLTRDDNFNHLPFLFLTAKSREEDKIVGLNLGAVDYISKPFSIQEIKQKITSIINVREKERNRVLSKAVETISMELNTTTKNESDIGFFEDNCNKFNITKRERDVLTLLVEGKKYDEIANCLYISSKTVNRHVQNLFQKTGSNNKVQLCNKMMSAC